MTATVIELDSEDARRYLMRSDSYCSINLPCYFDFQPLLDKLAKCKSIPEKPNAKFLKKLSLLEKNEANYILYTNKDSKLAWRPLQLINPVAYTYIVKILTEGSAWAQIIERFKTFQSNKNILCCSLPVVQNLSPSVSETISTWYTDFEKQSIKRSLDFNCMLMTDISNCYASIYTHSIAWALNPGGKESCKAEINGGGVLDGTKLHNAVDKAIRDISEMQTNGIPQGSVLMDLIAEMVLGYADFLLSGKIAEDDTIEDDSYLVLRYRDDYRIFTRGKYNAEKIARYLGEVLLSLNLRLNENKTKISESIVTDAQKSDKLYWRNVKQIRNNDLRILQIHSLSEKHPNSGELLKALTKYHEKIESEDLSNSDLELIASVATDIAYNNPKTYPYVVAIIGRVTSLMSKRDANEIFRKICRKFLDVPNSVYFNLWLQRLSKNRSFEELESDELCAYVDDYVKGASVNGVGEHDPSRIWRYDCFPEPVQAIFEDTPIVNLEVFEKMRDYPAPKEVKVFQKYQ